METMNISLPEPMKSFVDEQVSNGGYSSASEYIRGLLREEQKRQVKERLESFLLEGLDSGEPSQMTKEYLEELRHEALGRLKAKKSSAHQ